MATPTVFGAVDPTAPLGITSDPALEGSMYYDVNSNQVLQYSNGSWVPAGDVLPSAGGGGGGGGGGGWSTDVLGTQDGGYTAPAPAPSAFSTWGGDTRLNTELGNIGTTSGAAATSAYDDILGEINAYDVTGRQAWNTINDNAASAYAGRTMGNRNVIDMVGQGLRSGGVMLNSRNAGDSSAVGALGQAYGRVGNKAIGEVQGQFSQAMGKNKTDEENLRASQGLGSDSIQAQIKSAGDNIVEAARGKLIQLESMLADVGITDKVSIAQEIEKIKAATVAKLSELDALLTQKKTALAPGSEESRRAKAAEMVAAGNPGSQFNFTPSGPAQFQGTGPYSGQLPIFTLPGNRNKREA